MITTNGKLHIKRFLASQETAIGMAIAFGLGASAESVNDTYLNFEVDRADVTLISYDFVNNQIVFKGNIPTTYEGKIYEVGLYNINGQAPGNSKLVTSFDSISETWVNGGSPSTFTTNQTRIGADSVSHTPAALGSTTSTLNGLSLDLSNNLSSDRFSLAFYNTNTNIANIKVRFKTDSGNYYEYTITSPSAGYQISSFLKASFVSTGSPNWNQITTIEVVTTANASGTGNVSLDGIRIDDTTYGSGRYVLVAREVLPSPYVKKNGMIQEIKFTLDVSV